MTGPDVARMLADRVYYLSEEKYTELAAQVKSVSSMDNVRKVGQSTILYCVHLHDYSLSLSLCLFIFVSLLPFPSGGSCYCDDERQYRDGNGVW